MGWNHISDEEGAISVAIKTYLLCFREIIDGDKGE